MPEPFNLYSMLSKLVERNKGTRIVCEENGKCLVMEGVNYVVRESREPSAKIIYSDADKKAAFDEWVK